MCHRKFARLPDWPQPAQRTLDFHAARKSLLTSPDLGPEGKRWLDQVSLKVHSDDQMYVASAARQYLTVGLSALRCVDQALKISRTKAVRTILDLPCGHGRVEESSGSSKQRSPRRGWWPAIVTQWPCHSANVRSPLRRSCQTKRSRSRSQRNLT
jgi:hypothetical protein